MRAMSIACIAMAILLASSAASASLVPFTFPAIQAVYGGDTGNFLDTIGGLVKYSNMEIANRGTNASAADSSILSGQITSMPGPMELLSVLAPPGKSDKAAKENINKTLTGKNLTYYSIAGKPMNYTITADSIKSIEPFAYKGKPAWKVRVGEGLAWDLIMDAAGTKILKTDQLFRT